MTLILDMDYHRPYRGQPVLTDWLDALGVGPKLVRRVRVLQDDAGQRMVEITRLAVNEAGHVYHADGVMAEDPPFAVPLTAPIPDQLLALHGIPADAPPPLP